jgi:hypothetical protein
VTDATGPPSVRYVVRIVVLVILVAAQPARADDRPPQRLYVGAGVGLGFVVRNGVVPALTLDVGVAVHPMLAVRLQGTSATTFEPGDGGEDKFRRLTIGLDGRSRGWVRGIAGLYGGQHWIEPRFQPARTASEPFLGLRGGVEIGHRARLRATLAAQTTRVTYIYETTVGTEVVERRVDIRWHAGCEFALEAAVWF